MYLCREQTFDHKQGRIKTEQDYRRAVLSLGGLKGETRGSGTKTALLASLLAIIAEGNPEKAVLMSANAIGSDSDTIGTMAGSLAGSLSTSMPNFPLQDIEYIKHEAERVALVRFDKADTTYSYPDLLNWKSPDTFSDSLFESGGNIFMSGLGPIELKGDPVWLDEVGWQWGTLSFGQSVFVKRRKKIEPGLPAYGSYTKVERSVEHSLKQQQPPMQKQSPLKQGDFRVPRELLVDEAFEEVRQANFHPLLIGKLLLQLSEGNNGVDKAIGFAALVSKARNAYVKKAQGSKPSDQKLAQQKD